MGRGVHCTESEKNFILKLNSDGLSIRKIAQLMKCSKTKVFNAIHSKKVMKLEVESIKRQRVLTNI